MKDLLPIRAGIWHCHVCDRANAPEIHHCVKCGRIQEYDNVELVEDPMMELTSRNLQELGHRATLLHETILSMASRRNGRLKVYKLVGRDFVSLVGHIQIMRGCLKRMSRKVKEAGR